MTEQTVTLRIVGENGKLVATVRSSRAELDSLGKSAVGAGQQAQVGARGIDQVGNAAERTQRRVGLLGGALGQLKGLIGGYLGVQGVRELSRAADSYSDIVGKLKQATNGERALAQAKADTYRIAQQTYQSLDATVTLYSRSAQGLAQYNVSQAKVAELTQTINRGLLISRATGAESASAILQLSQAMGAGALRGEEFNAVNEAAPRLMQLLADSMGVPRGALKDLAADGKITIDVLLKAFTGAQAAKLAAEASQVPLTIGRAWQLAKNEMLRYIGESDQAAGTSAQIAQGIKAIGQYLPAIVSGMVTAAKIASAYYLTVIVLPRAWDLASTAVVRHRAALAAMGLTMTSGIGASTAASLKSIGIIRAAGGAMLALFAGWQIGKWLRENFIEARLFGIAFVRGMLTGWEELKQSALIAWAGIKAGFVGAINIMRNSLADFVAFNANLAQLLPDFMGGDAAVAGLQSLESALRPTTSAADDLAQSIAAINAETRRNRDQIDAVTSDMADFEIAQQMVKSATDDAGAAAGDQELKLNSLGKASKKSGDELKRLMEAQRAFARENDSMAAELAGPLAQANLAYKEGVEQAQEALAKGETIYAEAIEREQLLAEQKRRTIAELEREADVLGRVSADYEEQIYLSGLSARERRIEEQVIRAVADAEEVSNRQRNESLKLTKEQISDLRDYLSESQGLIEFNESQQQQAQEFAGTWTNAIGSVSAAFGDWFARGLKGGKDFVDSLKQIFQRWLADVITMIAKAQLGKALSSWGGQFSSFFSSMASSGGGGAGGSGGGGFFSQLVGTVFKSYMGGGSGGSGGFASAGTGGGMWTQLLQNYAPTIAGWLGLGGSAAASLGAYGSMLTTAGTGWAGAYGAGTAALAPGAGVYAAGAGGGAVTASSAGSGAAAGIGAVGWIAAIVAGMYMNSQWYKEGWRVDGQTKEIRDATIKSGFLPAMLDTQAVVWADKFLQALGVNGKWAAIISGSAGMARAWGFKKPELRGTGFEGGVGFNGTDARNYADIHQKGGWFRSDKNWTEYGQLSSGIEQAFMYGAGIVKERALDMAKMVGINIDQALAGVRIDLGKRELSKNAEEAKKQIEAAVSEIMERLSGEAIKVLGFERILSNTFSATDTMAALSTAIGLVSGSAEDLGRALTDLEKENIARAVEYFQDGAMKTGSSLVDEVQRVVGLLGNYSALISGVDAQLKTSGLNEYQRAQLDIETNYRNQVKQANELAKALGLTGARSEDLAKIEQLRALRMGTLQTEMERQKNSLLQDLSLSGYSPLTDAQKLEEAMTQLRAAVASGDLSGAQNLSQSALGFGRNLFASGQDYNSLYNQVTGLVGGMKMPGLDDLGATDMGDLADILLGLPEQIARAMFNLLYNPTTTIAPPPVAPPVLPPGGGGRGGGGGGGLDGDGRCVTETSYMGDGTLASDTQVGDVHLCHVPCDGFEPHALESKSDRVLVPCVRLHLAGGGSWSGSRTTPFNFVSATEDLQGDEWAYAPDMADELVITQRGGRIDIEVVTWVEDIGLQWVIPQSFGGRSFPAGDTPDVLVFSHNAAKGGGGGDFSALMSAMTQVASNTAELVSAQRSSEMRSALNA